MGVPESPQSLPPSPVSSQNGTSSYAESHSQAGESTHFRVDEPSLISHSYDNDLQSRHGSYDLGHGSIDTGIAESTLGSIKGHETRFVIPTKGASLSSGFPFHPRLYDLQITHDQWHIFSNDIVNAGKLSFGDDYLAWATGITTAALSSPLLLVLGPVAGYYSGKRVHKKMVVKAVEDRLLQEGNLRSVLRRWNEETFIQKGFKAWLELPKDGEEIDDEFQGNSRLEGKDLKAQKRLAKKTAERFRIVIIPNDYLSSIARASSRSSQASGSAPSSLQIAADGHSDTTERHARILDPPAYEDHPDVGGIQEQRSPVSPPSPSIRFELASPDSSTAVPDQYRHSSTFTNTL